MQDGSIRINRVNPNNFRDLSNYWKLSMHDNFNGFIPRMCFSYDEKYFFTCGYDGNVFSYTFHPENNEYTKYVPARMKFTKKLRKLVDEDGYTNLSLEEIKVKAEEDRKQKVANDHKKILREKIGHLKKRYKKLKDRNARLLPTQVIPREELEIDERITKDLQDTLDADLALVKRKLAFDVEKSTVGITKMLKHFSEDMDFFPITMTAVRSPDFVKTMRQRKLGEQFYPMKELVEQKIIEEELKGRYNVTLHGVQLIQGETKNG